MPSSARKSSIGAARRGIQKAHIPYRGDNPEVGKKTGIAVKHVERMSDGFERFEEVLQQADDRTPPRPKGRKKSMRATQQVELDEDGEMSMDIDDSPIRRLSSARIPSTPTPRSTNGSSRPVARTSEIDFDDIPSPRPRGSISRSARAGRSSLSKAVTTRELTPDSDSDNEPANYENGVDTSAMMEADDDLGMQDEDSPQQQRSSPRRKSFSQIDHDARDESFPEEDGQAEEPPVSSPRTDKGKRKARLEDIREEDVENGIEQELNDLDRYDSDQQGPEPSSPPKKKQKATQEEQERREKAKTRSKKENREYREGVRRSKREHYKPLEWWRGEKVVYGRTESAGRVLVPAIKEIRRIPLEPPLPLSKKRGSVRARSKSKPAEEKVALTIYNPEEGWDDETEPMGEVYDLEKQTLVRRRLVWTARQVSLTKAGNNDWLFEKVFGDGDFVAAGQLLIPPECRKPTKATKDNTYIFYVIEGAVNFKVHEVSKVVATGGMFIAPRGNTYFIENISTRDAKLFFTQARKVPKEDNEAPGSAVRPGRDKEKDKRKTEVVRSSSPGQPSASTPREGGRTAQSLPPAQQSRPAGNKRAPSARI